MDFQVADVAVPDGLQNPPVLRELKEMKGGVVAEGKEAEQGLRFRAVREEALRVGAQTGLAYRYGLIMEYLNTNEPKLNVTFSFAGFVKEGRLLVPAIVQTPNQFILDQEKAEARVVRDAYTIEEEAKIISVVPTWRDYLWQQYGYPEPPHSSMLPRSETEVIAWKAGLDEGWRAGVRQADSIYQDRLASLTKAVEGRHLYKTLESKEMISPAALKVVANRVTFNGRTMNVGEVIYSIKDIANYKQSGDWRPVWTR
ncbi:MULTISPECIES: type IV secretory system conjugative DNA transfer family protein [Ectopseudomonas]|uniref:Defect in organelle trafficking protein DotC n=2 Tax=Ectopseudomonas TaxID=3236654 RepID=A0A1G6PSN4_9GAMM|nr:MULTISPECIES: type IV secretory system conjugative DNA transfer family protein [Pseudomonas]ALN21960.1 hypothetical protein DW68_025105 [Pseudomonas mendocina S5.2]KER97989.1 hypothetical protein HN51_24580 [Pseudomonas mendocina]MBP3061884.1 type IV secretory system conjugative DNA transfer family protein [Pseudomonas chengduensis]NNB75176.1 type IV secretion system DotC family protein [Pseudomonas chengduensis]SDC82407.1 defect in organelle trafficking protein DotC [Pseudomonas chengduens